MIVNFTDANDRDAYLNGQIVFYLNHDIPIKNARNFLKEIERRVRPDELTIAQDVIKSKGKFVDKLISNGWRIFCYDDFKSSFKYNLDFRFERLVDGHLRRWWLSINQKSLRLVINKSFEFALNCTWGEFIKKEKENDKETIHLLGEILTEIAKYIVPVFHSNLVIAASNIAEYRFLYDFLRAGNPLEDVAGAFKNYFGLPLWVIHIKTEKDLEEGTLV